MGYRIDPVEPTDRELRRLVGEQLGRAVDALRVPGGPDAEAVHDARKRLKKARSALRLGRADLGAAVARHANAELRRVGADLAEQRDADALVEAVDLLLAAPASGDATTGDDDATAALAVVRGLLVERAEHAGATLDRATVLGAARTLAQTATWLDRVPPRALGWEAIGPGFAREYRRGRDAFRALPDEPTVDELHEWRKRVKDLWYHQRLLRRLWTEAQRPIVDAADDLASTLGLDHDLGLLLAHLAPAGERLPSDLRTGVDDIEPLPVDDDVRRAVAATARARRVVLQSHARRLGDHLYADRPGAWADRHGAWWATAAAGAPDATDAEPAG